jgi:hypothetical protein
MYLEPIFGSADILEQMPKEGTLFHATDKVWRRVMLECEKTTVMLDVRAYYSTSLNQKTFHEVPSMFSGK